MSFSSTPLGQDRRLDHQAFLKGAPYSYGPNAPAPKRVPFVNQAIPISYTSGATDLATRSSKQTTQTGRVRGTDDSDEEVRHARYNQLKQRNESLANRPGSSLGPGVITTPPQPNPATLNPTSVNIASAFYQAASSQTMAPTTSSWTSSRANLPRSTSVEYEQETRAAQQRRLAGPPRVKPPSVNKTGTNTHGSDVENDHPSETNGVNGRGKSPFNHLTDYAQRAVSQATFLMRQRSQEPEDVRPPSRQTTDATLVPQNNSNSYDYAEEEEEFREIEKSAKKTASAAHRRNRISVDNKAYRPTVSDEEEESEEDSDDDRRGRRKKKKRESGGGPLTNMPSIQYDKRRKRKGRTGKQGEEDISVEDEQEEAQASEQRSRRSPTPQQRRTSVPRSTGRGSVPPDTSRSYNFSGSREVEPGLDSIPEVDELSVLQQVKDEPRASAKQSNRRSRSHSRTRPARHSTIGGPLGKLVNFAYVSLVRLLAFFFFSLGRILGFTFGILIREPLLFVRRHPALVDLSKFAFISGILYFAYLNLNDTDIARMLPTIGRRPSYVAPRFPPESMDDLTSRLLRLENMLVSMQSDAMSERARLENDVRRAQEIASRVNSLESRIEKEIIRMQKSGEDIRNSAFKGLEGIQREIRSLQVQQAELSSRTDVPRNDEEARAKLQAVEERLGSVEGGVKEALEISQSVAKAGSAVVGAGSSAHWWSKLTSGSNSGLMIKTNDGSDITQVIKSLVEQALMYYTADGIARVDYALSSGGGSVIPSLTSPTLEIRSSYLFGLVSGSSMYARSPLTALHHETALGYCWPFQGSKGHLGVKLATPVRITDFTVDHVAQAVAHDMRTAPRHMEVWGLVEGKDNLEKIRAYRARQDAERQAAIEEGRPVPEEPERPRLLPKNVEYMRIGTFMYDINAPHSIQTFSIPDDIKELGMDFGIVVLFVNDNWGSDEFTCLYRFRVHGERKHELPAPNP